MCEIPPQFLSNLHTSLFLKTHIWADPAGFARNTFGVVGKGPREAGTCGNPCWGWNLWGTGVFGDRGCSEPPCGILHCFSYSSACEKHPRKKEKQQLLPWVLQAAIRKLDPVSSPDKNHFKSVLQKRFLPPSILSNNEKTVLFSARLWFNLPS